MLRNKKLITVLLSLICLLAGSYAQGTVNLAERYLNQASDAFEDGDINTAYKRINSSMTISMSEDSIIPANTLVVARQIYKQRLLTLKRKYDEPDFIEVKTNLEKYSPVVNTEITKLVRQIEAMAVQAEKDKAAAKQDEFQNALKSSIEEANVSSKAAIEELGTKMIEQQEKSNENVNRYIEQNEKNNKQTQHSFRMLFILILIVVIVVLLVILLIVAIVRAAAKANRQQQQQYVEAFKLLAANQSQTNQIMIGGIAGLYSEDGLKLAGASSWSQTALPEPEETPEEKEELRQLAAKCEDLGAQIDQFTGRKNNSKNVSELVFKIATKLGVRQHDAMVYFCASMVYDAGFLDISEEILQAESLTPEQKAELDKHVEKYESHLQFVPRRYWQVFDDAAKYHHENFDGSGRPEGLKGKDIPDIARIIRVADSFNALSSRRTFRGGTDKESALEILEQQSNLYDSEVIAALKDII
jgi:HD-GYP domain-containing protein (c-di-GMP phosphodiesterase class II)